MLNLERYINPDFFSGYWEKMTDSAMIENQLDNRQTPSFSGIN